MLRQQTRHHVAQVAKPTMARRATIGIAAISARAAAAAGPGWRRVEIAADMQADTLIALAVQLAD